MSEIKCLYANIRGLATGQQNQRKLSFLSELCESLGIKIIILTESHLKEEIKDSEIQIKGFNIHRCDRTDINQGGVIIYTHQSLEINEEKTTKFSNGCCELLTLNISSLNTHIVCLYRPPNTKSEKLSEPIKIADEYFNTVQKDKIIFIGDMNLPFISWKHVEGVVYPEITSGDTIDNQNQAKSIIDLADKHFMMQLITEPTREKNVLDLLFSNHSDDIEISSIEKVSNVLSDHNFIYFNFSANTMAEKSAKTKPQNTETGLNQFQFWSEKCEWEKLKEHLNSTDWNTILNDNTSIDKDIESLYNSVYEACSNTIPKKGKSRASVIPRDRAILMRKRKLWRKKLLTTNKQNRKEQINRKIVDIEVKLIRSHESERLRDENKVINDTKRNTKAFYGYAKKFASCKSKVGPLINEKGEKTEDPVEMSKILKEQYEKAFNNKSTKPEIKINSESNDVNEVNLEDFFSEKGNFNDINIDIDDIISAIKETKINSAPGPDSFPPLLLHKCKEELAIPLKMIMNKSIKTNKVPQIWKAANITCIHKGGDKSKAINYRPVSLTSILAKLMERIIRWYLVQYLELNNAFPDSQHGFRSGRSTISQLLEHYENIIQALEEKSNIDIIMLDYSKAFDKINISILLHKLKKLGISGSVGKWLGNFLLERKQKVSVSKHLSDPSDIISGVPQGTILAPILFLIYIADIGDNLTHSSITSYADDSKISKIIATLMDGQHLLCDLHKLFNWTEENLMTFNIDKFEVLRIGKDENMKNEIKYTTPEGKELPEKTTVKDLGIIFNNKGDFSDHISVKSTKGRSVSGLILRTFITREAAPLMMLFKALVIPVIEYGSIIWNPHKKGEINEIESVQRYYTSKIEGMEDKNYHQRLKDLKIYSLERRRERYDLLYAYKILSRSVPNIGLQFKWSNRRGRTLVPPPVTKNSSEHAKTLRNHAYRARVSRLFNSLPQYLRNLSPDTPLVKVKSTLDRYLATIRDEPTLPGYSTAAASNSMIHQRRTEDSPDRKIHRR